MSDFLDNLPKGGSLDSSFLFYSVLRFAICSVMDFISTFFLPIISLFLLWALNLQSFFSDIILYLFQIIRLIFAIIILKLTQMSFINGLKLFSHNNRTIKINCFNFWLLFKEQNARISSLQAI
jgi:hypothetical protein